MSTKTDKMFLKCPICGDDLMYMEPDASTLCRRKVISISKIIMKLLVKKHHIYTQILILIINKRNV